MIAKALSRSFVLALAAGGLISCGASQTLAPEPVAMAAPKPKPIPSAPTFSGPVLNGDGTCSGPAPSTATLIEPGIGECDLVRLKGRAPTDVLVGEGRSGREVQVLYTEPGAKELYFFVNNRLDRIVK